MQKVWELDPSSGGCNGGNGGDLLQKSFSVRLNDVDIYFFRSDTHMSVMDKKRFGDTKMGN